MKLFLVLAPFTLLTYGTVAPGQVVSFKEGDIIKAEKTSRTRGGFRTSIPILTTNYGWVWASTESHNLREVHMCGMSEGENDDVCVSPYAEVIDNEAEGGGSVNSTGSKLLKGAAIGFGLYMLFK